MQAMNTIPPLAAALLRLKDREGINIAQIGVKTGVNRSTISNYVNHPERPIKPEHEEALWRFVNECDAAREADVQDARPQGREWKDKLDIYPTSEHQIALGWCENMRRWRKMGVLIGYPGSGKTTVLKAFCAVNPGASYIEAWPNMRMGDLLEMLGRAAGITLNGNSYTKAQQIIAALRNRTDVMIIIDEAEYLRKWDVDKFEILRKIWDNTGTPIIFSGTPELETILTRGGGRDNLSQLYRRKYEMRLEGVKAAEARTLLQDFNVTPEAVEQLVKIVVDYKHGGMGNFAELLNLCLETVGTELIDEAIVREAMGYKLLYN